MAEPMWSSASTSCIAPIFADLLACALYANSDDMQAALARTVASAPADAAPKGLVREITQC